jgi:hypothetical protein
MKSRKNKRKCVNSGNALIPSWKRRGKARKQLHPARPHIYRAKHIYAYCHLAGIFITLSTSSTPTIRCTIKTFIACQHIPLSTVHKIVAYCYCLLRQPIAHLCCHRRSTSIFTPIYVIWLLLSIATFSIIHFAITYAAVYVIYAIPLHRVH